MTSKRPEAVEATIATLAEHPSVSAITLGGSRAASRHDLESDHDIEVFVTSEVPTELRRALADRFDPQPELDNRWFGTSDEWIDRTTGTAIDIAYFDRDAFEHDIRAVIERHRPRLGYTTAFWYTLRHAEPVFDRDGWLASMRTLAGTPYPDSLRWSIVAWNHPLLRSVHASWRNQIALAVQRDDPVSINHRTAALLASVFDILFALARTLHPGEKRLLDHLAGLDDALSPELIPAIRAVLDARSDAVLPAVDCLCDLVDDDVRRHGLRKLLERP